MKWMTVAGAQELREGEARVVRVGGLELALARWGGTYYALENICPHAGGSLGDGFIDARGQLHCAWHSWPYDLATGRGPMEGAKVKTYPVRVRGADVEVDVEGGREAGSC
jgi:nitrite reductase/ring-hydroxylating ferredoxin subunit